MELIVVCLVTMHLSSNLILTPVLVSFSTHDISSWLDGKHVVYVYIVIECRSILPSIKVSDAFQVVSI